MNMSCFDNAKIPGTGVGSLDLSLCGALIWWERALCFLLQRHTFLLPLLSDFDIKRFQTPSRYMYVYVYMYVYISMGVEVGETQENDG
jgi:hypothetical protein